MVKSIKNGEIEGVKKGRCFEDRKEIIPTSFHGSCLLELKVNLSVNLIRL